MGQKTALFLGPFNKVLIEYLKRYQFEVTQTEEPVKSLAGFDAVISYNYKHIISAAVLNSSTGIALNLHISLLPWNRGADPNIWSFIENTPKGVTIHRLEYGLDKGEVLAQKVVQFDEHENTLALTYERLHHEIQQLFKDSWLEIFNGSINAIEQSRVEGSYHTSIEKSGLMAALPNGWDSSIEELLAVAKSLGIKKL